MTLNIRSLIDDVKCYEMVRDLRWPDGVRCPHCDSAHVTKQGRDETQPARQRYECRSCHRRFDDLTGTICAGHHQPLRVWILCLYFMGLNLSNEQIAQELDLNPDDAQVMASQLRGGIVQRQPEVTLSGGLSHGTTSIADSWFRNSSGVSLRNSQKLNPGSFRPSRPYGA